MGAGLVRIILCVQIVWDGLENSSGFVCVCRVDVCHKGFLLFFNQSSFSLSFVFCSCLSYPPSQLPCYCSFVSYRVYIRSVSAPLWMYRPLPYLDLSSLDSIYVIDCVVVTQPDSHVAYTIQSVETGTLASAFTLALELERRLFHVHNSCEYTLFDTNKTFSLV